MYLTQEEQAMLDGEFGSGIALSMKLLTRLGDAVGAKRMIRPASSHIVSFGFQYYGFLSECRDLDEQLLAGVTQFKIPATTNPKFFDTEAQKLIDRVRIGKSALDAIRKSSTHKRFEALGAIPTYTCTPFFVHPTRQGEYLAGAESIAIVMYNSVYGARLNRETAPTALAAAVTGRTPFFGLHDPANRQAQLQVNLDQNLKPEELTSSDLSALGYFVGGIAKDRNVVFNGLPENLSMSELKTLLAPLGVSGAVALAHVVGVTPEAPNLAAALHGKKPEDVINIHRKHLDGVYEMFNVSAIEKVDVAVFGCPHATLAEVIQVARILEGKRIRDDAFLMIATTEAIRGLAERMGLLGVVESSGGLIVSHICPHIFLYPATAQDILPKGITSLATNSTKCALLAGGQGLKVKYGDLRRCVEAVI